MIYPLDTLKNEQNDNLFFLAKDFRMVFSFHLEEKAIFQYAKLESYWKVAIPK